MKSVAADLHIHTALSPCADREMRPPAIASEAVRKGIQVLAICDHNTAQNAAAVQAAAGSRVFVLAGMEIATAEDIHVLGLFPDAATAQRAGQEVRATLPAQAPSAWGDQTLLDRDGREIGRETAMLAASSGFALAEALALVRRHGGLAIASHVDRPSFSVLSQLGVWPRDAAFDAVEVSAAGLAAGRDAALAKIGLPVVASSDSHFLADIGCVFTRLRMADISFGEVAAALKRPLERVRADA